MSETRRFALIVASYSYQDAGLRRLIAPPKDAEALARVLRDQGIGEFDVKVLLNRPSHESSQAIETFFTDRHRDDLLLLYFSGHGIKDEDGQLYFATPNTRLSLLRSTAIPAALVNDVMRRSRSRRQVLLLDCCYSGAFARGLMAKTDLQIGTQEYFDGRGRVVLTASDAMQYSFEGETVEGQGVQSIFTRTLVQGLETGEADQNLDGLVALDELYDYVHDRIVDLTPQQRPGKWAFDVQGEIIVARNPHLPATVKSAGRTEAKPPPSLPRQAAKETIWPALFTAMGWGIGWGVINLILLWIWLFSPLQVGFDDPNVLTGIGIVSGLLGGLLAGLSLRRVKARLRWLLGMVGWALGWTLGALVSFLQFGTSYIVAGSAAGAVIVAGLLIPWPGPRQIRQALTRQIKTRIWIYGRLIALILIFSGFFSPWMSVSSCSPSITHPEPTGDAHDHIGLVILQLSLSLFPPLLVSLLLLVVMTMLMIFVPRIRSSGPARWLERLGVFAAPVTLVTAILIYRGMIVSILWGFYVTTAGLLLTWLTLLGEWLAARKQRSRSESPPAGN